MVSSSHDGLTFQARVAGVAFNQVNHDMGRSNEASLDRIDDCLGAGFVFGGRCGLSRAKGSRLDRARLQVSHWRSAVRAAFALHHDRPASDETRGHLTTGMTKFYSQQLQELLSTAPQRAM
jgi:hypothetical protein